MLKPGRRMKRTGVTLVLSGVSAQPLAAMQLSGFLNKLGAENIAADVFGALNRARVVLGLTPTDTHISTMPSR